jgi:SMI1 / KNR4 family (SUKH-1)
MSEKHWNELYEDLQILVNPRLVPVAKPTTDDIAKFETRTGFSLPGTFKEFILVFGPGILAKEFHIAAPTCKTSSFDLLALNEERFSQGPETEPAVWSPFPKSTQLERLVAFCQTTLGNDRFGWDPEAITNSNLLEYAVFFHRRLEKRPKQVADSFGEFIDNLCLGDDFFTHYRKKGFWDEFFPRRAFAPALTGRYKRTTEAKKTRPATRSSESKSKRESKGGK